ncbi:MAG: Multidrug export protein EmrB [Chlamydiales bacterium]|nr:Multidrug export protein EmrB [Chlamydiales bacterium]
MSSPSLAIPHPQPLMGFKLVVAIFFVAFGTLLITLDQFIANVAIPTISGELGVSLDNGTWVITSYTVANAISIPLTGWLTSLVGRIRLFSISAILFAIMSFLCGQAQSFEMLLFFRVGQGLVSGSLIPLSQALLLMLLPQKKNLAIGIWGLVVMVGPAMGPVVGGWITGNINWRWIFNINVPLGILIGLITLILLFNFESVRKKLPMDGVGIALLVITVGAFQVMLDRGTDDDWFRSGFIVALLIITVIGLSFFLVWEHYHHAPVVDLSFFKSWNFSLGSIVIGMSVMLALGSLVVGPNWVQAQLGYTPLWAGYSIALFGVGGVIFFPLVGRYLHIMDLRIWISIGFVCMSLSFFYMAYLSIWTPFSNLAWPRLFQGVGFAFFFVPLITISLAGIPESKMPSAAGVFSFVRMLFISGGIALNTTYFTLRENFFQSRYVESVIPSNPQFKIYYQALREHLGLTGLHADAFTYFMVRDQAYTETFLEMCYLAALSFTLFIGLAFFFRPPKSTELPAHHKH